MNTFERAVARVWVDVLANLREIGLVGAGIVNLAGVIYVINQATDPSLHLSAGQLDVLKILGIILALSNAIVVIALAGVGVSGEGPAGIKFDVENGGPQRHVEANASVTLGGTT